MSAKTRIRPLAWESPYATAAAQEMSKRPKKNKIKTSAKTLFLKLKYSWSSHRGSVVNESH